MSEPKIDGIPERIGKFFGKLGQGSFGLALTYWVYGVLGGLILSASIVGVISALVGVYEPEDLNILAKGLYAALFVYIAFSYVGIWRASDQFQGNKAWAILAKFSVTGAALPVAINLLKVIFA